LTFAAVVKFQEKYAPEILATYGLTTGTGFVGTTTRAKLNTFLGEVPPGCDCTAWIAGSCVGSIRQYTRTCTPAACAAETKSEADATCAVAAGLTLALASDTPVAGSVPNNGNANFTKFSIANGNSSEASISKLYVTRTGLASNSAVENIKIIDAATGAYHGSIGSLNVDNRALITFTPSLKIAAGATRNFFIRGGIVSSTTTAPAGNTVALGLASASDIISDTTVSGTFPITGNQMTIVSLTIGLATMDDITTVDSQPDIGDTDVVASEFTITAGSTEAITVEQITAMESGTASLTDTTNIELYSVTQAKSLGTVSAWDAEGRATWADLGIVIGKGENHRFKIMMDVANGSGLTFTTDLEDGSDWLVTVKGNTYGFYITPTDSWSDGTGVGATQTINSGSLTVTKSASTPATGNISPATDQTLVVFDFNARGEEVKVSALELDFDFIGMVYTELTNIKIYDENGDIVAGPKDAASGNNVAFTDTFVVPNGTHKYTVKAKIASTCSTGDYVEVAIDDASTAITARGMTSNESITPSPTSQVEGNRMTVAALSLTATTLTQPAARTIAKGVNDFIFATASFAATSSGEDALISVITIEDNLGDSNTGTGVDIDNVEIWADLTSASSARGDVYETLISETKQITSTSDPGELAFTLTQTLRVKKGTFTNIAVVADLAAGATTDDTHTILLDTDSGNLTVTGSDTGTSTTVTPSGSGQAMTVGASGTLTVTVDSSSPTAALLLDENVSTLGIFRLAANNVEDFDLDNITVYVTGSYTDGVDTFYFYSNKRADGGSVSDPIQTAAGGSSATVVFSDGTVTIPANGNVLITVKALMNNVDGTSVQNGDTAIIDIAVAGDVDVTGKSSGAAIASTQTEVAAATHTLYEAYPQFVFNPVTDHTLIPSSNSLIGIISITANGNKDVTFQSGDSDLLSINISSVSDETSGAEETVTLKDEDGTTLDTDTFDNDLTSDQVDFNMSSVGATVGFTIPAGQTKKLYLYSDTTDYEDDGDTIQAWLDDTAADCTFGVDGTGTYAEGDFIFKGDIYGPSFVNPS